MFALVTGASRGIGAAAARRLAKDGYTVAVHCHRQTERAQALADEIGGIAVQADLSDFPALDRMAAEVLQRFGRLDLLVNNAGVSVTGLFQDISDADEARLLRVNAAAPMRLTKRVLPAMLHRHSGCIVNIASVWGEVGAACEVQYSASKAAVIGFTRALAKEVGPSGIRVNCVSPGVISTDMNACHSAETMQALAEETPLCRIGTPEDVADAVAFLASDRAKFITGQILPVNGGFSI
jgi:3-oxoacyl-[acyl-carrier protein] reductase